MSAPPRYPQAFPGRYVPGAGGMPDAATLTATLSSLHSQTEYLEHLLAKSATTLHALRHRQTRNHRSLRTDPPRAKRKKMLQNRWRTDKAIKTCENEERAVLDCLAVCHGNMHTIGALLCPPVMAPPVVPLAPVLAGTPSDFSNTPELFSEFEWNGWADCHSVSPFQRLGRGAASLYQVSPADPRGRETVALHSAPLHDAPLDGARVSALRPTAPCFEPSATEAGPRAPAAPADGDKLTMAGLLSSKRLQRLQKQRLVDALARAQVGCTLHSRAFLGPKHASLPLRSRVPSVQRSHRSV